MKANYIVFAIIALVIVTGGFFALNNKADSKAVPTVENTPVKQAAAVKDEKVDGKTMGIGYIMKSGKMMIEENDKMTPMEKEVTLSDGTVVAVSGLVTKKDGSTFTLTEGQSIWTDGTFMKAEAMKEDNPMGTDASALSTRYIDYKPETVTKATANNGKAVLFFAALAWCPSCQAADRDFKAHFDKLPKDVTIIKVDYDTAKDLKQKYAITMQDTFVQVDSQGKEVTRWNSGGQGILALTTNLK